MKRYALITGTILVFLFISLGFTSNYPTEVEKLRIFIQGQTAVVVALRQQVTQLQTENKQLRLDGKDDKIVLLTVDALTGGAVASRWANPSHIKYVMATCKKYEYIIKNTSKSDCANWRFVMSWCLGTGYNPNFHCDNDGNGYWDNGIGDLNDTVLSDTEKYLPKELRGRSWYNTEKSIAGVYTWMMRREQLKMSWAYLNRGQWDYYANITRVDNGKN